MQLLYHQMLVELKGKNYCYDIQREYHINSPAGDVIQISSVCGLALNEQKQEAYL